MIFTYEHVTVINVSDGDSGRLDIDFGFDLSKKPRFRLARCNAPEKGHPGWEEAKMFSTLMLMGRPVTVISKKKADKYGRCLCEIIVDGINLSDALLERGLATPYIG